MINSCKFEFDANFVTENFAFLSTTRSVVGALNINAKLNFVVTLFYNINKKKKTHYLDTLHYITIKIYYCRAYNRKSSDALQHKNKNKTKIQG